MPRLPTTVLVDFATDLLVSSGLGSEFARPTAEVLVEGDMIGHETHGVSLLPWYVAEIDAGHMATGGAPDVVADRGASFVWDGRLLPGAWLLTSALAQAAERTTQYGVVTAAIRNCHHTCALSAFLRPITERGLIVQLSVSNPAAERVAPFGGTKPLLTPNPLAAGFPTDGDPIMIDVSASITTTTMTQALAKEGGRFPEPWVLTAEGQPSDDPREVTERGGSIMALGGARKGHKGFGLALMVELLGQGLSGKGRANTRAPGPLAQSAFLQVMDPAFFAGLDAFVEQSSHLARACRENPSADPARPVRLPGDSAMRHRREALAQGVKVDDAVWARLADLASAKGVAVPVA